MSAERPPLAQHFFDTGCEVLKVFVAHQLVENPLHFGHVYPERSAKARTRFEVDVPHVIAQIRVHEVLIVLFSCVRFEVEVVGYVFYIRHAYFRVLESTVELPLEHVFARHLLHYQGRQKRLRKSGLLPPAHKGATVH